MCGLAGVAGHGILGFHLDAFQELLYLTALRGRDSTGVYAVRSRYDNAPSILKKNIDEANDFLKDYAGRHGFLNDMSWDVMMGHCRWATVGKITAKNAHPFDVGPLVGAHNGTLTDKMFLSPNKTDSEMMFERMASVGVKETLEGLSWWDAYAVSIWLKEERRLILARNTSRPLFTAICKNSDVMFWASEAEALFMISHRHKMPVSVFKMEPNNIYEIDPAEIKAGSDAPWKMTSVEPKVEYTKIINTSGTADMDGVPWGNAL